MWVTEYFSTLCHCNFISIKHLSTTTTTGKNETLSGSRRSLKVTKIKRVHSRGSVSFHSKLNDYLHSGGWDISPSTKAFPEPWEKCRITFSATSRHQHANSSSEALSAITDCIALLKPLQSVLKKSNLKKWSVLILFRYCLKFHSLATILTDLRFMLAPKRAGTTQLVIFVWHAGYFFFFFFFFCISHILDLCTAQYS